MLINLIDSVVKLDYVNEFTRLTTLIKPEFAPEVCYTIFGAGMD